MNDLYNYCLNDYLFWNKIIKKVFLLDNFTDRLRNNMSLVCLILKYCGLNNGQPVHSKTSYVPDLES